MRNSRLFNFMEDKQKSNRMFVSVLIFVSPFIDMSIYFGSVMNLGIPINQVMRLLMYILCVFFIAYNSKRHTKFWIGINLILYLSVLIYQLMGISKSLMLDINYALRVSYCFSVLILLDCLLRNKMITSQFLVKNLVFASLIVSINIIISPFGFGLESWIWRFGYRGYFDHGNVITQLLLITLMLFISYQDMFTYKKSFIAITVLALLLTGTRAGQIAILLIIAMIVFYYAFYDHSISSKAKKNLRIFFYCSIVLIIIGIFASSYYLSRNADYTNYDSILSAILSYRNHMALRTFNHFIGQTPLQITVSSIFGMGYSSIMSVLLSFGLTPTLEIDFLAAFFYSGIFIFIFILAINWKAFKSVLSQFRTHHKFDIWMLITALVVSNSLALINGHVFFETLVSPYFYSLIAICINGKHVR
ncbi:hypothetical protein AOC36_08500 [Erysipelothrix larvae]|uniref:Uncharacterized protein n=2 Tax=Erysipelothrix larvae TaxID=1514105 RepID=A0A0X8H126_9FIRM|nr:hypothetical protein AOC36_08500 [Erysipelothrix larvae]